jgi:hypothetical protein
LRPPRQYDGEKQKQQRNACRNHQNMQKRERGASNCEYYRINGHKENVTQKRSIARLKSEARHANWAKTGL